LARGGKMAAVTFGAGDGFERESLVSGITNGAKFHQGLLTGFRCFVGVGGEEISAGEFDQCDSGEMAVANGVREIE
jgi:hypothetical protein